MNTLFGLIGSTANVGRQSIPVANAQSFLVDGNGRPMRDPQGVPLEYPAGLVATFGVSALQSPTRPPQATLQWGAGGIQTQVGPFNFYGGLQVPIRGSWARIILEGQAPGAGDVAYAGGAHLSYGEVSRSPAILIESGPANVGTTIAPGATAALFPVASMRPFISAFRILQGTDVGGNQCLLQIGSPGTANDEVYQLPPGATDVWHSVSGAVVAVIGAPFLGVNVTNLDPANSAFVNLQVQLSL